MKEEQIKKEFQENFQELKRILNSRELIPGSQKDQFDALNHKILSHLYKGADIEKISSVLESELIITYGLFHNEFDIDELVSEIMEWWNIKLMNRIR